jgi:glycosyltransferase involved in cell wall biosynthesis
MRTLSIVVPALNEAQNLPRLMDGIPVQDLRNGGWATELIIVDNGSSDGTGEIAKSFGAHVVDEPQRGYGNAYKAGFRAATGQVVATGDADLTYPFDSLPKLIHILESRDLDFLSTNRLLRSNRASMKRSHAFGNRVLTTTSRLLFAAPFQDSQSGMWIFRREIWPGLDVRSPGMSFSQEIKHEAHIRGLKCGECNIEYRARGGEVKLNASRDGLQNLVQLLHHRVRARAIDPSYEGLIDLDDTNYVAATSIAIEKVRESA